LIKENMMSLIRWEPFGDADALLGRLMQTGLTNGRSLAFGGANRKIDWAPSADISETEKEYVIRAELPAVKREDVQVTYEDGVITIKGERKQQKEDKGEKFHRMETLYGSFERSFSLPDSADSDTIRCDSKDGILTVHIPKKEALKSKPKQITVQ
jgi:HSP20 family protein